VFLEARGIFRVFFATIWVAVSLLADLCTARASESAVPMISQSSAFIDELDFAPGLGYSSWSGIALGSTVALFIPLAQRVRLEFGGSMFVETQDSSRNFSSVFAGPTYAFSEDRTRTTYASIGLGYANHYSPWTTDDPGYYGFFQFGKHFQIFEPAWSWVPYVEWSSAGRHGINGLRVEILNFSYAF
jgi:hypothetical protein